MKKISGTVIDSKEVSLAKAAKILKGFVGTENGASQAISVFLKQTSDSVNELVQFHRDLKGGKRGGTSLVRGLENGGGGEIEQIGGDEKLVGKEKKRPMGVGEDGRNKKRKNVEVGDGSLGDSEERSGRRKKKKRRHEEN